MGCDVCFVPKADMTTHKQKKAPIGPTALRDRHLAKENEFTAPSQNFTEPILALIYGAVTLLPTTAQPPRRFTNMRRSLGPGHTTIAWPFL